MCRTGWVVCIRRVVCDQSHGFQVQRRSLWVFCGGGWAPMRGPTTATWRFVGLHELLGVEKLRLLAQGPGLTNPLGLSLALRSESTRTSDGP